MKKYSLLLIISLMVMHFQIGKASFELQDRNGSANHSVLMISPNDFKKGSDCDRIEAAIREAVKSGINSIEIPGYDNVKNKTIWLLDRSIVLPSDFSLYLKDCFIRLSPGTRDNLITNSGSRTSPLTENKNIKIIGIGNVMLSGGLETHFNPPGDKSGYRTIGILLYNTKHFLIENLIIEESQAWAISVENGCVFGRISDIEFRNSGKYPNQDGINIRKGCHDIIIENITGTTGDDMIALTGLRNEDLDWKTEIKEREEGKRKPSMHVGGSGWREEDDIYNITINNVIGTHVGRQCCSLIRLLNNDGVKIYNVFINDVMDTAPDGKGQTDQAINIGDDHPYWTKQRNQIGETARIFIDNVISNAPTVVRIRGTLKDSRLTNISQYGTNINPRRYDTNGLVVYGKEAKIENVKIETYKY